MNEEEFAAIKDQYVREVLKILRRKADNEAKLIFHEYSKSDGRKSLVELSMEISQEFNTLTDMLLEELSKDIKESLARPICREIIARHCPSIIKKTYPDRIYQNLPPAHQVAIVASFIASCVIYREGLGWLKTMPRVHWVMAMLTYMEKDILAFQLQKSITDSALENKEQINSILGRSAARDLTVLEMQNKSILP